MSLKCGMRFLLAIVWAGVIGGVLSLFLSNPYNYLLVTVSSFVVVVGMGVAWWFVPILLLKDND